MKDLKLLAKMLNDNLEDLQKPNASKLEKRIAKNNLHILGKMLANL